MKLNSRLLFFSTFLLINAGLRAAPLVAESADKAVPLAVGARAPGAMLKTVDGADFDLGKALATKPTILIFYRGGWCPYCNTQLAELQNYHEKFLALGYQVLALSTDAPGSIPATVKKHELSYTLLSDRDMNAASVYGVAWRVSGEVAKRYSARGTELAPLPGSPEDRWLPVPSVFIVSKDGIIQFVHSNPDFKVRPPAGKLLAAAEAAMKEPKTGM